MTEFSTLIIMLCLSPTVLLFTALADIFVLKIRGLWIAKLSICLLLILSLPLVEQNLAWYWETFPALTDGDVKTFKPQAIVVIGGGMEFMAKEYGDAPTVKPNTLLRLRYAAKLAKSTGLPVLASGGHSFDQPAAASEAQLMGQILEGEFSVPVRWLEPHSHTTLENAQLSRRILQQHGINKIILVTQAYHMPRAESEFRQAGFEVLAGPTDFLGSSAAIGSMLFTPMIWIPSVKALETCFLLIHESVGMLWYSFKH